MNTPTIQAAAMPAGEISPLNSLALVSAFLGEYINTMADRPATRECVRMQVEDALRRLEQALMPQPQPVAELSQEQPKEG